jgi:hypothetical protein
MELGPMALGRALESARRERQRADRAGAVAQRHDDQLRTGHGHLADLHRRLAAAHRQTELRHIAAAEIHEAYADRLRRCVSEPVSAEASMIFMTAVAMTARSQCAVVTMCGSDRTEALVAASSPVARAAQDLEFTLGEGPTHDALASGTAVYSTGSALIQDWPSYGAAAADLGVTAVAAVPLEGPSRMRLGSLAVFDPWLGDRRLVLPVLRTVAEALTQSVLLAWDPTDLDAVPSFYEGADYRPEVFQAAGIVMVQCRCDMESALALLRARAYALSEPIAEVSVAIVDGRIRMDSP